jgi:acyl-CoA reductase-like NAD-dependent aldehyde dehydrogenase
MVHGEMLIGGHFIGGPCDQGVGKQVLHQPGVGTVVGSAAEGGWNEANAALDAAMDAFASWRRSTRRERQQLLRRIASLVRERSEELSRLLSHEVGKPISLARGEVLRLGLTFDLAADALTDYGLEQLPVDYDPRGEGYRCFVERFPVGVVLGIVPYNWPFNLAAHKLAPALAVGNTIVLKPSQQSPICTLELARLIHEAGCPAGVVNAVNVPSTIAQRMAEDERVAMLSFTGSPPVGWKLKSLLPHKRVSLELGGNAYAITCADAELEWAVQRTVSGAFGYAGQICISVQHALAHSSIYSDFRQRLIEATEACPTGGVDDEQTICGPLINEEAAAKVEEWVSEAVAKGAKVIAGGTREGALMRPTLVEGVPADVRLACQEVFGPVLTLAPFGDFSEAIGCVNSSDYGIQTGVFTHDERIAEKAFRELDVGGVIINDYPTLRFDNMPYGGVRRSGFGREGVRYAMDEMTELKTLVVRQS